MRGGVETFHLRRSTPLLVLAARGRLDFNLALADLVPVSAKSCSAALSVALEHCTFRVFIRVAIDLRTGMPAGVS